MAVKIGNVWDSTTDVLAGRAALLMPVAALAFFLPAAVQAAIDAYGGKSPGVAALGAAVAIAVIVATLWGQMTVIGVASDPHVTRAAAAQAARRRLGRALLAGLVILAIFVVALLPIVAALAVGGFDFRAAFAQNGSSGAPPVSSGTALFVTLYGLAALIGGLWLGARLFLWTPVVLHEGRGIGAIGRSVALTRGLTLKLIAAALLLLIVYAVAALAANWIVFIVFRLVLGPAQIATATWLGGLASAAVGAAFSVVVAVFTARLYVALVPRAPFPPNG